MSADANDFNIWVPLEAYEKAGDLRIRGVITTEHRDQEGEVVLQDGLDFGPFLKNGYFNNNHNKDPGEGAVLGYPLSIKKGVHDGKKCHHVVGHIYKEFAPAKKIHQLASAMGKDPRQARQLGFSLQGGIQTRKGALIPKKQKDGTIKYVGDHVATAIVRHVAITHEPVNAKTNLEALCKALQAGGAIEAPAASSGEGFPLRQESLDGQPKKKKRTKRDAVEWLMKTRGIARKAAERVWTLALLQETKCRT